MNLYTFALIYDNKDGSASYSEEIDIEAPDALAARARVREVAEKYYRPGYRIKQMPTGGTGGSIIFFNGGES